MRTSRKIELPRATVGETLGVLVGVVLPVFARGVIIRRPKMVAVAERLDLDRRAVRRVQRLRSKYGSGPLVLRVPVRSQSMILDPSHVHRALEESPDPFTPATWEKKRALSHFQPEGVLISKGKEREDRRRFNEQVLDSDSLNHRLASQFVPVVQEEAQDLMSRVDASGVLDWDTFAETWFRVVRRIVFGDAARDDAEITAMVDKLRSNANWAFMKPRNRRLRKQFLQRVAMHLERAEPGSLAAVMASTDKTSKTVPEQQVPQWLFAFDPAGMTTFRTLALLASHPAQMERARDEITPRDGSIEAELPFLRATILESLRLWPTTPMVLRESTAPIRWEEGEMPAKTNILIFANYFHRDDQYVPYADEFSPDIWFKERTSSDWPFVPFSGGTAICPGRNLVQMLTSNMLASILEEHQIQLVSHRSLKNRKALPGTLNNYRLRFEVSALADRAT